MIGEKSAKDLSMDANEGIWLANVIFLPIALFLVYKAKNDYQLFNFNSITRKIVSLFMKHYYFMYNFYIKNLYIIFYFIILQMINK